MTSTEQHTEFDAVILGGGLAGLVVAIRLAQADFQVALVEKKTYPFHRVCGEYISNETVPFLRSLGFDPFVHGATDIRQFRLTGPGGTQLSLDLEQGGFGLSRYTMDAALADLARTHGAAVFEGESVMDVDASGGSVKTNKRSLKGRSLIGAFGKRSTIDRQLQRGFLRKRSPYAGIKMHFELDHPPELIELHNFQDGYLGINRVEGNTCCMAYLTSSASLRKHGSIPALHENVLSKNKHIKRIFEEGKPLYEKPLAINEVTFVRKPLIDEGVLMCGDAAGMIAPLCGNGMAMAIHSAKILSDYLLEHLSGKLSRSELEQRYTKEWEKHFKARLWVGRTVQRLFGNARMTDAVVASFGAVPPLARWVVKQTHGEPF